MPSPPSLQFFHCVEKVPEDAGDGSTESLFAPVMPSKGYDVERAPLLTGLRTVTHHPNTLRCRLWGMICLYACVHMYRGADLRCTDGFLCTYYTDALLYSFLLVYSCVRYFAIYFATIPLSYPSSSCLLCCSVGRRGTCRPIRESVW